MVSLELRAIIEQIHSTDAGCHDEKEDLWKELGAKLMIAIDKIVITPELVNNSIPKDYSQDNACPISSTFVILKHMISVNQPFNHELWRDYQEQGMRELAGDENKLTPTANQISFYELALSRCCSIICKILSNRLQYLQKLLLKNIFGTINVCSLFASDIYMFIFRIIHPHQKTAMCQILMNICRYAPPEAVVNGAALVNRLKHPVVNFDNPKYMSILDL